MCLPPGVCMCIGWLPSGKICLRIHLSFSFLPEAKFGLRVLSSPMSVCISITCCPHDNSSPVHVRITEFSPEKQNTLVKIIIVLGGNWLWPSMSNSTSNSKLTPCWGCPKPLLTTYSILYFQIWTTKCILALQIYLLIWGLVDLELHFHF